MVNIRIEQACFFEPRSHEDTKVFGII